MPTDGPSAPDRATIPILDEVSLTAACARILEDARERVKAMESLPLDQVSPETVLDQWDLDSITIENILGPIDILGSVHPDKKVRDASDACLLQAASFSTEVFQNEKLYERVRAVKPNTPAQTQLRKDLLEAFEDRGVSLSAEKRRRFKDISDEINALQLEFGNNIKDNNTRLTFSPQEYDGLPQSYIDRVEKDADGNIVVGFDYPDFNPFMANSKNEAGRKRYYIAYMKRGTPRNVEILDRIVALRKQIADLYEVPSYAHYVTKRRMVEKPDTVHRFLSDVKNVVTEVEKRDVEELRKLKADMTGSPIDKTELNRWDAPFYRERYSEKKFDIDQEELRRYFPTREITEWLLDVTGKIYGVTFERAFVPQWHEDVMYYDVRDSESNQFIGGIYLDLFPREGKYKHAAAWGVRGGSRKSGRKPISVLVTNFDRNGLTHDELETFFHEIGHVLHGVFSETEYNQHAGTSVQRDFVEAPSQMYEEWARRLETLETIRETCPGCPVMDRALVARLNAARKFGQGLDYARQHLYAAFDMALSSSSPPSAMQLWQEMEGASPLGYVEGTAFPGTFGHIAGGYAAGYYGYMWSEVLALDMLSAFGENIMNPEVGKRFRKMVLSRGGEEPARQLVERFLGRPVNNDAFFAEIRGKS